LRKQIDRLQLSENNDDDDEEGGDFLRETSVSLECDATRISTRRQGKRSRVKVPAQFSGDPRCHFAMNRNAKSGSRPLSAPARRAANDVSLRKVASRESLALIPVSEIIAQRPPSSNRSVIYPLSLSRIAKIRASHEPCEFLAARDGNTRRSMPFVRDRITDNKEPI